MANRIREIPITRWIVFILLTILIAVNSYNYINFNKMYNYDSLIYSQTNDLKYLCIYLLITFLVIMGDFMQIEDRFGVKREAKIILKEIFFSQLVMTALIVGVFLILNLIVFLLMKMPNYNIMIIDVSRLIHSIILFYLRMFTIFCFVWSINYVTKKWWGAIIAIILSFFEYTLIDFLRIESPTFIIPFEHSVVSYKHIYAIERPNVLYSYIYWIILIIIIMIILFKIIKYRIAKDGKINE